MTSFGHALSFSKTLTIMWHSLLKEKYSLRAEMGLLFTMCFIWIAKPVINESTHLLVSSLFFRSSTELGFPSTSRTLSQFNLSLECYILLSDFHQLRHNSSCKREEWQTLWSMSFLWCFFYWQYKFAIVGSTIVFMIDSFCDIQWSYTFLKNSQNCLILKRVSHNIDNRYVWSVTLAVMHQWQSFLRGNVTN